jgi:hypothetical protein
MTREIFVSTDIEADGPIPGPYSMLSLGSAAFVVNYDLSISLIEKFSVNLDQLPSASQDQCTMNFWSKHPNALKAARKDRVSPEEGMIKYFDWLKKLPGKVVFTAWPATYDFMFVNWYLMYFVGESPFQWSGLDAKSYFMGMSKQESWLKTSMKQLPSDWIPDNPEPHIALNDAIEQGWMFCHMYAKNMRNK